MGKRLILGTRPEVDPLQDVAESKFSVSSDNELRWDDREQRRQLAQPLFLVGISIIIGVFIPLSLLITGSVILVWILIVPYLRNEFEIKSLDGSQWKVIEEADTSCAITEDSQYLKCKTPTGTRTLVNMSLTKANSVLLGDVSSLVRAIDHADGFCLTVTLQPEKIQRALDEERVTEDLLDY